MALTTEATTALPATQTPSGWTNPATTITFAGTPFQQSFSTTIAVAGVSHATVEATGLTQLIAAVKSWIDGTWIPNTLKLEFTIGDVDGIITVTSIARDNAEATATAKLYLTGTDTYTVSGYFRYE